MSTVVTVKGQVTIPKRVRDQLGIKPGTAVDFVPAADGGVKIVKSGGRAPRKSRFDALVGTATVRLSTDEIMALTRGED